MRPCLAPRSEFILQNKNSVTTGIFKFFKLPTVDLAPKTGYLGFILLLVIQATLPAKGTHLRVSTWEMTSE